MEKNSRFAQLLFRNIDWDVNSGTLERFDENASLGAGAGAKSDQLDIWPEARCDIGAILIQNVDLGSSDVIFGQFANFLKERRAPIIVKIFGRKRSRIAGKTGNHVCQEIRTGRRNLGNRWDGRSCFGGHYGIIVRRVSGGRAPCRFTVDRARV